MTKPLIKGSTEISGKSLVSLLDGNLKDYTFLFPIIADHNKNNPQNITDDEAFSLTIPNFPVGTRLVKNEKYQSGEVWKNIWDSRMYLYIGKLSNGRDVVLDMGTEGNLGFLVGHINRKDYLKRKEDEIFFDDKVLRRL